MTHLALLGRFIGRCRQPFRQPPDSMGVNGSALGRGMLLLGSGTTAHHSAEELIPISPSVSCAPNGDLGSPRPWTSEGPGFEKIQGCTRNVISRDLPGIVCLAMSLWGCAGLEGHVYRQGWWRPGAPHGVPRAGARAGRPGVSKRRPRFEALAGAEWKLAWGCKSRRPQVSASYPITPKAATSAMRHSLGRLSLRTLGLLRCFCAMHKAVFGAEEPIIWSASG